MQSNIEVYKAKHPLNYYEVGTVYAFYGKKDMKGQLASTDEIKKFSGALREVAVPKEQNESKKVKTRLAHPICEKLERFYAVVTEKIGGTHSKIGVMFWNESNGEKSCYVKKYAVGSSPCWTDGKNLMPVSASTKSRWNNNEISANKVGGITKSNDTLSGVGGITRSTKNTDTPTGIGGITRSTENTDTPTGVGGITRSARVGGITRSDS